MKVAFYDVHLRKDSRILNANCVIRYLQFKAANMGPGYWGNASGYTQAKP